MHAAGLFITLSVSGDGHRKTKSDLNISSQPAWYHIGSKVTSMCAHARYTFCTKSIYNNTDIDMNEYCCFLFLYINSCYIL